jgi:hypothetical protein
MKRKLTERERENLARCKRVRAAHAAEQNRLGKNDPTWPGRRERLEAELRKAQPHLMQQRHCGLCDGEQPTREVLLPNGRVLHSAWYSPPKTEADARKAAKEQAWLTREHGPHFDQQYVLEQTDERSYWLEHEIRLGRGTPLIEAIYWEDPDLFDVEAA